MMRNIIFLVAALSLGCGVHPVSAQSEPQDDYFVEAAVSNARPFVGEQIIYSFLLYDAVGLDTPLYEPSDFEGFWHQDIGITGQEVRLLGDRQYSVTTLTTILFPTQIGSLTIESPRLILPATVFGAEQVISATPISIQVQPLPDDTPVGFSGLVGQIRLTATIDRQSVTLGESVSIRLNVTGSGNIERLGLPNIIDNSLWRVFENPFQYTYAWENEELVGSQTLDYILFARRAGLLELPAFSLIYFDPITMAYQSATTAPLTIEIRPSDAVSSSPAPTSARAFEALPSLTNRNVSTGSPISLHPIVIFMLLLIPPAAAAAVLIGQTLNERRRQRERDKRRQRALRSAIEDLKQVSRLSDEAGRSACSTIIQQFLRDRLNENAAAFDGKFWLANGYSEDFYRHLQRCRTITHEVRFAPSHALVTEEKIAQIVEILQAIDRIAPV